MFKSAKNVRNHIGCHLLFFHIIQWESSIFLFFVKISCFSMSATVSWTERRQTGGLMDGWTEGRMDQRTNSACIPQDFVSIGAAARLASTQNYKLLQQGAGTDDHILLLIFSLLGGKGFYYCLYNKRRLSGKN